MEIPGLQMLFDSARVLSGTIETDHMSPILASLYWLPSKSRNEFEIFILTYKVLNHQPPTYFFVLEHFTLRV